MALYVSDLTPSVSTTMSNELKRCPHKIPTIEELNPEFAEARVFSKMDAKAGYWSIHLDEAIQEITPFRTPFGRYCYRRLPFGLCVSQDLFQQAMDRILARAPGCVGIADDVVVYGRDNTEHDKNLLRLMQVAKEEGLVFNSKKCVINTSEIVFFGSVYGKEGIKTDPSNIEDIRKMPTPHTRQGSCATVHRFDELFGGIYTAFRRQGVTVARTPQEGRPIRVARRSPAYL